MTAPQVFELMKLESSMLGGSMMGVNYTEKDLAFWHLGSYTATLLTPDTWKYLGEYRQELEEFVLQEKATRLTVKNQVADTFVNCYNHLCATYPSLQLGCPFEIL